MALRLIVQWKRKKWYQGSGTVDRYQLDGRRECSPALPQVHLPVKYGCAANSLVRIGRALNRMIYDVIPAVDSQKLRTVESHVDQSLILLREPESVDLTVLTHIIFACDPERR